jgi:hypothetical protein
VFGLGRRVVDLAILFLAAYAFVFVPLGKHTGLELVRGILRTHAAEDATREIGGAVERVTHRVWAVVFGEGESPAGPDRAGTGRTDHGFSHRYDGDREVVPRRATPVVPRLPHGAAPATFSGTLAPVENPDASI